MEYIFSLSRPNFCHSYSEWTPPTANVNKRVFFFRDVLFLWRTGSLEAFGGTHCCSMPTIFRHINCRYLRAFEQFSRIAFFFVGEGKGVDGGRGGGEVWPSNFLLFLERFESFNETPQPFRFVLFRLFRLWKRYWNAIQPERTKQTSESTRQRGKQTEETKRKKEISASRKPDKAYGNDWRGVRNEERKPSKAKEKQEEEKGDDDDDDDDDEAEEEKAETLADGVLLFFIFPFFFLSFLRVVSDRVFFFSSFSLVSCFFFLFAAGDVYKKKKTECGRK